MSTRGFIGVVVDNQVKGCYNHFDSYPAGLGVEVVQALQTRDPAVDWKALARAWQPVKPDVPPTAEQVELLKPYTNLKVSEKSPQDWYCLLHGLQGQLLESLKVGLYEPAEEFLAVLSKCIARNSSERLRGVKMKSVPQIKQIVENPRVAVRVPAGTPDGDDPEDGLVLVSLVELREIWEQSQQWVRIAQAAEAVDAATCRQLSNNTIGGLVRGALVQRLCS